MQGIYTGGSAGSSARYILQGVHGIYTTGSAGYILQGVVQGIYAAGSSDELKN